MDFIKSWVMGIITISIFSVLIEILLPSSDTKRFVKVVTGLLVVLVIIQPFLYLKNIKEQFDISMITMSSQLELDAPEAVMKKERLDMNTEAIAIFEKKMEDYIAYEVMSQFDLDKKNVQVKVKAVGSEQGTSGVISHVDIAIAGETTIKVDKVENVQIGGNKNGMNKDDKEYTCSKSKLSLDIAKRISRLLDMDPKDINVTESVPDQENDG